MAKKTNKKEDELTVEEAIVSIIGIVAIILALAVAIKIVAEAIS